MTIEMEKAREFPGVSCLCLCYGRISVLEEAISCFLRQDYKGPKELIVLNDLDAQTPIFDHPEVKIINERKRYPTLGEKRNASCEAASFDIFCPWDDDDISLSHRLDLSISLLGSDFQFIKPTTAFFWNNGKITSLENDGFHAQSCFRRKIFDVVGGYTHMNSGEDQDFEKKLQDCDGIRKLDIPSEQNFYFYRWEGVEEHISGYALSLTEGKDGYAQFDEEIRRGMKAGSIPTGNIKLRPHWKHNYEQQAREFLQLSA